MAVRRVDTLGCHPLVLMKKLAAIGGLEILKEEKHTHDSVDYPYHIVAKVKDGLYVEAKDPLYEQATDATLLPKVSTTGRFIGLECFPEMFSNVDVSDSCVHIVRDTDLKVEALGLSALFSVKKTPNGGYTSRFGLLTTFNSPTSGGKPGTQISGERRVPNSEGITVYGKEGINPPTITIGDYWGPSWSDSASGSLMGHICGPCVIPVESSLYDASFGVALNFDELRDYTYRTAYSKPNVKSVSCAYIGSSVGSVLVLSGTVFRVSNQISGDSLVLPSEWKTLPCTPIIINNDAGLFFCYNAGSTYSGMVGAVTIDTSKGNGIEGSFPAIYDSGVFCGVRATGGEKLHVLGSPANPAGTVTMQLFSPNPPIPVDSVSGGPVVTDLFAYSSEEIRGSVEGLLAARDNLPVGSVGWLDGKRYRVHLPGRMLQIG